MGPHSTYIRKEWVGFPKSRFFLEIEEKPLEELKEIAQTQANKAEESCSGIIEHLSTQGVSIPSQ